MSNHFHLLLHAKDDTVGNIVKRIASSYVYYFNGKYGRTEKTITERVNESVLSRVKKRKIHLGE